MYSPQPTQFLKTQSQSPVSLFSGFRNNLEKNDKVFGNPAVTSTNHMESSAP
jgi:hypothetical protein